MVQSSDHQQATWTFFKYLFLKNKVTLCIVTYCLVTLRLVYFTLMHVELDLKSRRSMVLSQSVPGLNILIGNENKIGRFDTRLLNG